MIKSHNENNFLGLDISRDLFIIAEIGVNHEGSLSVAENIIKNLKHTGVSAVKLQSFTPNRFVSSEQVERLERIKKFQLSIEEHYSLMQLTKSLGMKFISTPVTEDWVMPLSKICDALKIASGDIDFLPTIHACAESKLPTIMSTGAASINDVDFAVENFKAHSQNRELKQKLALLHCVSEYPAKLEDCNLKSIDYLKNRYGVEVGWSNHVVGSFASQLAIIAGASILELHVTDKKTDREFRDHSLSFETTELRDVISELRMVREILGTAKKERTKSENQNYLSLRKGLVYTKNKSCGEKIFVDDVAFARPATFFNSNQVLDVVGQVLTKDVFAFETIKPQDFSGEFSHVIKEKQSNA